MTTRTDWYADERMASLECLRQEADCWRRRAEKLAAEANGLAGELADLKCRRDCRLVNQQHQRGVHAADADRRRERVEWWTCLAYLVVGWGLGVLSAWSKGGMP